jgi:hypothetical protein
VSFLGYTAVFTVGISFGVQDWFSEINLYMCPRGSIFRDVIQGAIRVRYTKTPLIHMLVGRKASNSNLPTTFESILHMYLRERHLLEAYERKQMDDIDERTDFKPESDFFVYALCWNKLERNLQLVNPMKQVKALLAQLNWTHRTSAVVHNFEDVKIPRPPL